MGLQESRALSVDSAGNYEGRPSVARSSVSRKTNAFSISKQAYDIRYGGNIKICRRSQNTRDYVQIKRTSDSQLALERELRALNRRIFSPHPNQLRIDCYTQYDTHTCCSVEWHVNIYVEYLDRDLEQEIAERRLKESLFMEHELIYLIENLSMGLNQFEKSQHAHGDIRPSNILIDSFGVYKYIDHELIDLEFKASLEKTQTRLFAPEVLTAKPGEKPKEPLISDIFSLGMTMLQAATLEPSCELYDYTKREINRNLLEERLNKVRDNYSLSVYLLISSALTWDPKERPRVDNICDQLSELGDSLVGRGAAQSFVLDRVHAKQGASTNNLSIERGDGFNSARERTPEKEEAKVVLTRSFVV